MDPPHFLYHLITEFRTASLLCFIGNFTIRFQSSTGRSLWEETSNIKIYFVGRFAVGSGSLSKTLLGQGYLQETCEAYHSWCKQLGNTCKWHNVCGIWMFWFQMLDMEINGLYGAWVPQELARCCTGVPSCCHPQMPPSCLPWPWLASCTSSRYSLKQWTANRCRAHWKLSLRMSFGVRLSSILQTSLGTVVDEW